MSAPLMENLEVYFEEDDGAEVMLPTTSSRYRIVKAIVHLALSLLETREGRRSLAVIASDIIRERNNTTGSRSRRARHIYTDSMARMPYWIDVFLQSLRDSFPRIIIGERGVQGEAQVEKFDWGSDMRDYDARSAGVLAVKKGIITNMVNVLPQRPSDDGVDYSLFKFQMVVSVAHEMVHLVTGFVTGTELPHTPPGVNAAPYNVDDRTGEAGRRWECDLLGGFVEMWSVDSDPLGSRQPGVPFLFPSGPNPTTPGRQISLRYVEEFLNREFTFPIRTSTQAQSTTRRQLQLARRREMTVVRESRAFRNATPVGSPPPRAPDAPEPRYRRIALNDSVHGYSGSGGGYSGSGGGYSASGNGYSGGGSGGDGYTSRRSYR